jgi:hypothetical protein
MCPFLSAHLDFSLSLIADFFDNPGKRDEKVTVNL